MVDTRLLAQTNTLVNEGSAPVVGAGHNYIYGISETVIPSNGTVSLKIDLPSPKGRGISFPLAVTYNSGAVHRFSSFLAGCGGLDNSACTNAPIYTDRANNGGGWTDTLPYTTATAFSVQDIGPSGEDGHGSGSGYACSVSTSYNFFDANGGAHPLGLAALSPPEVNMYGRDDGFSCRGIQNGPTSGYTFSASGGDDEVTAVAEASCAGDNGENIDCGWGPSFTVTDLNGTQYFFPAGQSGADGAVLNDVNNSFVYALTMKDRNGNILRFTPNPNGRGGGLPITDTLGRVVVSASTQAGPAVGVFPENIPTVAGQPRTLTYTVGGLPYTLTYTTTTASYHANSQQVAYVPVTSYSCNATFASNTTIGVVQSLSIPDGTSYQFKYDPTYGLVSEIDYPTGGWVKYQWKLSDTLSETANFSGYGEVGTGQPTSYPGLCLYEYQTPVVAQRTVGYSPGSAAVQTQTFTYNTAWNSVGQWVTKSTSVLTTDNVTGQQSRTVYTYGPVGRPVQVNEGVQFPAQLPVETSVQTFGQGRSTPLKTVTKTWADQFKMTSQQTQLDGGPISTDVYCYSGNTDLVQEKDEYDFGKATLNLTPSTSASNPWVAFSPTCGSSGLSRKTQFGYGISSAPCITVVYDGNGNRVAETDAYLDGGSSPCLSGGVAVGPAGAVANLVPGTHDETNYGPSAPAQRGNPTKIVSWLNTGAPVTTTATYDETGQILTSTDPCGNASCTDMTGTNHTTTYSYADSPAGGNPAGQSNAYVTQITDPLGHPQNFSYNYANGQVIGSSDQNSKPTSYVYNDPLGRLTQTNSAGGGQKIISYNDSVPSVTTTIVASPDPNIVNTSVMDGMGHVVQTQSTSDPAGTDYVDITYDGSGRVYTKSNPHRSGPSPTDGITTFNYDSLGRMILQKNPDTSTQQWCYNGMASAGQVNCSANASSQTNASWVDYTDEAGRHWQRSSDALGRLTAVMEPDPSTGALALETDYTYDPLNNLLNVNQRGAAGETALFRRYQYDALSRLTLSCNPEKLAPGQRCDGSSPNGELYNYDLNGNLLKKTDGGSVVNFSYDALNRLTGKSYTGSPLHRPPAIDMTCLRREQTCLHLSAI